MGAKMNTAKTKWDAVVIGSGLGGLTAAAYLATNGLRTLVLEQHFIAGGNCHVFRRKRLYEFDVGVHYVGDCGPDGTIPTVLRGLGLEGKIEFLEMDADGFDTLIFPDLTFRVPKSWERYRERLVEAFPDEETGLHRCVDVLEKVAQESREMTRAPTPEDVAAMPQRAPTMLQWGFRTLAQLYDECGLTSRPRAVIAGECGTYAMPPSRTPVLLHAALIDHYLRGAYYPKGGGQVFAGHLVNVIRSHGGEVRTRQRVRRILVDEGKVRGVEMASGELHEAPVVVSNADLKRTFLDLVGEEHISAATAERVKSFRMALPLFCVYLGLDIDLRERGIPNTNLFLFDSYDLEGIHEDCYEGRLPPNLSVFMTIASIKDPHSRNIAPEGHTNLQLMTLVPPHYALWGIEEGPACGEKYRRTAQYRAVKEQLMEALIARANEVVPGLADHIVWKEAASPITQERYTLSTGGTSYGIEMAPDQFGPSRPAARTEIDGLYLAGASTQSGHGVAGVMISGVVTAGAVLDTNLMKRIREGEVFGRPELLPETGPDWDPWRACF